MFGAFSFGLEFLLIDYVQGWFRELTPFGEFNTVNFVPELVDSPSNWAKNSFTFLEPSNLWATPWKRKVNSVVRTPVMSND